MKAQLTNEGAGPACGDTQPYEIAGAQSSPFWPRLRALAPTLRYDAACLGDVPPPRARLAGVTPPVLLTTGAVIDAHRAGRPIDFFGAAADAAAGQLPDGRRRAIELSGHVPDPAVLGPVLAAFYGARSLTGGSPRRDSARSPGIAAVEALIGASPAERRAGEAAESHDFRRRRTRPPRPEQSARSRT